MAQMPFSPPADDVTVGILQPIFGPIIDVLVKGQDPNTVAAASNLLATLFSFFNSGILVVGSIIVSVLPWQQTAADASWRVVDGKQRIEALRRFTSGGLAVPGGADEEGHRCRHRGGPRSRSRGGEQLPQHAQGPGLFACPQQSDQGRDLNQTDTEKPAGISFAGFFYPR